MIQRGKFLSLTMVNWNGFFARTFDLDALVTTLSGGNGAGKSTTMAAFITAMIPDQSLLHFRNTTEAGSSSASRDKGLHGKLKPGVCYAMLNVMNSLQQRIAFGVRLQQIAGRDKKVDIKPFILQGFSEELKISELLIESVSNTQARIRQLNEVKEVISQYQDGHVKSFSSIVDYHAQLFDLGVLPKKLRNATDRSKFYRLIEASLYGGISSAITKSLRDYLLPQNGGVKKAFQDMETALKENRATLEAIKLTQRDRDLFKHLVTESTNYVASDYMRHTNERRKKLESALAQREQLLRSRQALSRLQTHLTQMNEEQAGLAQSQTALEHEYQEAASHFQLVRSATQHKEKIVRYQEDLQELLLRFEEQALVVEESRMQLTLAEEQVLQSEEEVDSLKTQLADYQQALNMQQTRALQYQQAQTALEKAQKLTELPELDVVNASELLQALKTEEEQKTAELLALKHKLDLSSAAALQFERGRVLVAKVIGEVSWETLASKASEVIEQHREYRHLVQNRESLNSQQRELAAKHRIYQQALQLKSQYHQQFNALLQTEQDLEKEQSYQQEKLAAAEMEVDQHHDKQRELASTLAQLKDDIAKNEQIAPTWLAAKTLLERLAKQTDTTLDSHQAVITAMHSSMAKERQALNLRDALAKKKTELEEEMERLNQPGGDHDLRLQSLADSLGGTLLSEIYDDIALCDAPYFSALYGPARHAIVLSSFDGIQDKLVDKLVEDCPNDLYLIEGDISGFDDSLYQVEALASGVCVHLNERQLRFSRFPTTPLFGRAAREQQLDHLRNEHEHVQEKYTKAAFDTEKWQRINARFAEFVASHLQIAFIDNPEALLKLLREKRNQVQRESARLQEQNVNWCDQFNHAKTALALLGKMQPVMGVLEDDSLCQRIEQVQQALIEAKKAQDFIDTHGKTIAELETLQSMLNVSPTQRHTLEQAYNHADEALQKLKKTLFALADLNARRSHFSYHDASVMLNKSSELSEQLKQKLAEAEVLRANHRDKVKQIRQQHSNYDQLLISLKSAHQAKLETVQEFQQELDTFGVQADEFAIEQALIRQEGLTAQLANTRSRKSEVDKSITLHELEIKTVLSTIKKVSKEYKELRTLAIKSKANWVGVLKIARASQVDKLLNRREMAYMAADELRSLSDKSLGALRLAVADNEVLRDALRFSEDAARPERKVLFYVAVYQHLRERIRQDIIHTENPIDAIEEMEVELARLTQELTLREKRLVLSSELVANIIRKTILREQNRIHLLNQGLSNVTFGQVKGVRLRIDIQESHVQLLMGLTENAEQHQDCFTNKNLTFSESMARVFQRVNPHIDIGQRSLQILGEELLDYRNYLALSIEVNRGTDGWLQAESGALSTGEAIGTGQAILLMVVQSWEEESRRLRAKNVLPCRLLFLDEAARLDAKSITTLFELCHRLDMQLLIAAPENISPEQGITYKLVRKIFNDKEHVHVVGLRGFANMKAVTSMTKDLAKTP